jgi:hypothetical protein
VNGSCRYLAFELQPWGLQLPRTVRLADGRARNRGHWSELLVTARPRFTCRGNAKMHCRASTTMLLARTVEFHFAAFTDLAEFPSSTRPLSLALALAPQHHHDDTAIPEARVLAPRRSC